MGTTADEKHGEEILDATTDEKHEETVKVISDMVDETTRALDTIEDDGGSPDDEAYSELLKR